MKSCLHKHRLFCPILGLISMPRKRSVAYFITYYWRTIPNMDSLSKAVSKITGFKAPVAIRLFLTPTYQMDCLIKFGSRSCTSCAEDKKTLDQWQRRPLLLQSLAQENNFKKSTSWTRTTEIWILASYPKDACLNSKVCIFSVFHAYI